MRLNKDINFRIEGKDYELLRKWALRNDNSISKQLRKIIKQAIRYQKLLEKRGG